MRKLYILCALFLMSLLHAQNAADRDPSFNQFPLPMDQYYDEKGSGEILIQPDGKILMRHSLSLSRRDGNVLDTSFNSFPFTGVTGLMDMELQPDGKILVVGSFTTFNGIANKYIIRLNADGTKDNSFAVTGTGFSNPVENVKVLPDGKIIVCGMFQNYNGVYRNSLARLNSNGSLDTTFTSALNLSSTSGNKLVVLPDNKLLVTNSAILNRLNSDGTIDPTFTQGSSGGVTNNLACQADGKIVLVGAFTTFNATPAKGIVRLNANGTIDTSFSVPIGFANNGLTPKALLFQPDGKIVVAGNFSSFNGTASSGIVRLNPDGSKDTSFVVNSGFSGFGQSGTTVSTLALQNDGKLIAAGYVYFYDNFPINHMTRINADGSRDASFTNIGKGFDYKTDAIARQPDGKILVAGAFGTYNGIKVNQLVRLNADGSLDPSFSLPGTGLVGISPYSDSAIKCIAIQPDGKILVGGNFTALGNVTIYYLIRLNSDGSRDTSFTAGSYFNYYVTNIIVQPDGKILVNGMFDGRVVRLNANGTYDGTFTSAFNSTNGYAEDMLLQPDGKVLISGLFDTTINSIPVKNIMRLNSNGTMDTSFSLGFTASRITKMGLQSNNKIIIAVTGVTGSYAPQLKRINADGSDDSSFAFPSPGTSHQPLAFLIQPDGKVIVSSSNNTNNGNFVLERLNPNGTIDSSYDPGSSFNAGATMMLAQPDGKVIIAGEFTTYKGLPERRIVRLLGEEYYSVQGTNKFDGNTNGCDAADPNFPYLNFQITGTNNTNYITNTSGNYNFGVPAGTYTVTPTLENPAYFNIAPASVNVTFPTQTSPATQNFCVTPVGNHPDLEIAILPLTVARPGFDATYKIIYKNKGNQTQSGTVTLDFNDAATDLVTANPVASTQALNSLTWNYSSLLPLEIRTILVTFNLNSPLETPALNSGSILNYTVGITPTANDATPNDNSAMVHQTVVNSLDPNDKTCLEGSAITTAQVGDYVHYVIRFENKGTYSAQNISVKDAIDTSKFDINTLTPLSGSSLFVTKITEGNKVEFYFKDINLPFDDANNDGYVAFKIKTKATLVVGDSFSNTASIYFDYNSAINTNVATTTIQALAVQNFPFEKYLTVYPNPVNDQLIIDKKEKIEITSLSIFNTIGQQILTIPNAQKTNTIDVSSLKTGTYFLKINSDKGTSHTKFIKL